MDGLDEDDSTDGDDDFDLSGGSNSEDGQSQSEDDDAPDRPRLRLQRQDSNTEEHGDLECARLALQRRSAWLRVDFTEEADDAGVRALVWMDTIRGAQPVCLRKHSAVRQLVDPEIIS